MQQENLVKIVILYLQSTMPNNRLNRTTLLHVYNDYFDVNINVAMEEFIGGNEGREKWFKVNNT